ncbi:hypothetical protein GYMLUDRAFT_181423, partial [Collybiopsis luxurians FD-317 M1]
PLPRPPSKEFQNSVVVKTIHENLDLFAVPHIINIDHFESLLQCHPNQPFIKSVLLGLKEGFWPSTDMKFNHNYPTTWDSLWSLHLLLQRMRFH